jgi:hypothetical protein
MRHLMALIEINPVQAKREIIEAFVACKCHYGRTHKKLGCSVQSLARWVRALGIKERLVAIEQKALNEGWHHGIHGGAQYHRNKAAAAAKRELTRRTNKVLAGKVKLASAPKAQP